MVSRACVLRALIGIASLAIASCDKQAPPPPVQPVVVTPTKPPAPAEPGSWYRAKLDFDKVGELAFFMHVPPLGEKGPVHVVNGDETIDFTAEWRDNEVTITAPWNYTSVIQAEQSATGGLTGTWTRDTPLWGQVVRNFTASKIDAPDPMQRYPGVTAVDAKPPVSVAGSWEFKFAEHGEGEGKFEQGSDGVVRGFMKPGQLGDIRFLAGNVHGTKLSVSQFNGNSANLVLAEVSADGATMSGMVSMQNVWNEKFTAKKVAAYHFVNKVRLKEGKHSLTLKGLDKYKGKPTLALIFATWCSSCNDAAPFFHELYETFHPQGLEVLSVAYDLSEDQKENQVQIDFFRKKYNVPWEILQVPSTPETWASVMPPELEGWDGLPIIALVKADGTVQTVFGGWFGPATGDEGVRLRKWFVEQTKLLVESAKH